MTVTMQAPTWSEYEVQGSTLAEVAEYIQGLAEAGDTKWQASYQVTQWGEGDNITTASVDVQVTVSMPRWAGASSRPQAEQDEWNRFVEALRSHEQGHIDLAQQYLEHADTLIEGFDEKTAAQQWQDNLNSLQQASDQYDSSNDHGRNAGTTITLPDDTSSDESLTAEDEAEQVAY
jgi:predicted secreted Zn-dependent protease